METLQSWSDAGDWSDRNALIFTTLLPRMEAIRLAILERMTFLELDPGDLALPIVPLEGIEPRLYQFQEAILQLIPHFAHSPDGCIHGVSFFTHDRYDIPTSFNTVNLDSWSYSYSGESGLDEGPDLSEVTITDGFLHISTELHFDNFSTRSSFSSAGVQFNAWHLDFFRSNHKNLFFEDAHKVSLPDLIFTFYTVLKMLRIPHTLIHLKYDDYHEGKRWMRIARRAWYDGVVITYTDENGTIINSIDEADGLLTDEEIWARSSWGVIDQPSPSSFSSAQRLQSTDTYMGKQKFCSERVANEFRFKNLSKSGDISIPIRVSYRQKLIRRSNIISLGYPFSNELGEENTWLPMLEVSLPPDGVSDAFRTGFINTPPIYGIWEDNPRYSRIEADLDLYQRTSFHFL